jgi:hypothetical protein
MQIRGKYHKKGGERHKEIHKGILIFERKPKKSRIKFY